MHRINVKALGFAVALTVALVYAACIMAMAVTGPQTSISFFNSLMHGIDGSFIIRKTPMQVSETLMGIAEWFVIGWLMGASVAAIYNAGNRLRSPN
jgi:hypothetical protein